MLRVLAIAAGLVLLSAGAMVLSRGPWGPAAEFVFVSRGEVGTLDIRGMAWLQDIRIACALWEGLYTLDPQTLKPVLGAADHVEVSRDGRVYTFQIRPQARWSNGEPLEAGDFVFSWRRSLEEPGDYTYLLYYIEGAREYSEEVLAGRRGDFTKVKVAVTGPRILRVTLKHPVSFFPELCAFPAYFPQNERSMRRFAEPADPATGRVRYRQEFTRPPNLVSNGPYRLASWEFKRRMRLEASEFYWDRAQVKTRVIEQLIASDPQWAFLKYETGTVEWISDVPAELAAEMKSQARPDLHVFPGLGTYFYSLNCQDRLPDGRANPLRDRRVRQALSMAINREAIVRTITRLGERAAWTYIPPGAFREYRSPRPLVHDVPRARALLAEAGYPGGRGFPQVSIIYNTEGSHGQIAQYVRRQWMENLGIAVDLEALETKVFRNRVHDKKYAIARASWVGDYDDPSTFIDRNLSYSENNDSGWVNPDYDRLAEQAAREVDAARRMELLARAEELLCQEAPIIPLYHDVNAYMLRDRVRGVPLHPRSMVMLKGVQVVR